MNREKASLTGCPAWRAGVRLLRYVLAGMLLLSAAGCAPALSSPVPATQGVQPGATAPRAPVTPSPGSVAGGSTQSPAEAGQAVIHVVRSGGIAGRTEEWTVYGDGRIAGAGVAGAAVGAGQVSALLTDLDRLGFFSLNDTYAGNGQCRDCFNYDVTVTRGGQSKTVHIVEGATGVPAAVSQALDKINQVIGAAR